MHLPHLSSSESPASELPVLRLGVRPFYLGGALFGVLAMVTRRSLTPQ